MAKTAGNLFFLDQILRHRTEVPEQAAAVPSSVRHVVGERVARHGPSLHRLLRMCAVMGHEVDVELLADVAAVDRDTALDLLETATAGGLMMNPSPKRYVFAHALVTITLYEELSMSRRAEIHRRVAEALEHVRPNVPAAQLAHHWLGAQDDQRAIYACRDAGDQALALFSPTEAASWYQKARELTRDNAPLRCELQILLGAAQRQAGLGAYEATSSDAFAEACRLRRPDLMADAVLAAMRPEAASNIGRVDQAITALGKEPTPRRARLLSAVAVNLSYDPDTSRRNDAARTAVHTARRSGRDETLLAVLVAGVEALRAPDTLNERLTLSAEAVELSQRLADRAAEFWALCGHANALDEAGRRSEVDTLVERRLELAELLNQPTIHVAAGWAASKRAWLDGSLDEAERLALQMGRRAQLAGHPDATTNLGSSLWPVLRARGVWGGPKITVAFEKYGSGGPIARASSNAMIALDHLAAGRTAVATDLVAAARDGRFWFPFCQVWSATMGMWCEAVAAVGDVEAASILQAVIDPFADHFATHSSANDGCFHHHLGVLAATQGNHAAADEHFVVALRSHLAIRAPYHASPAPSWRGLTASSGEQLLQSSKLGGSAGRRMPPPSATDSVSYAVMHRTWKRAAPLRDAGSTPISRLERRQRSRSDLLLLVRFDERPEA